MLAAVVLALHDDAGWFMCEANSGRGFIDVLPPCPAGAIGVFADVFVPVDFDFQIVFKFRDDIDSGEGGLPPTCGIEGTDADQAMVAGFAFEVAIDIVTADGDRGAADAGFFSFGDFDDL